MTSTCQIIDSTWRGMPAWQVTGSELQIVLTKTGGHLASLTRIGEDLNPFWQPAWPAAEPEVADEQEAWGTGPERGLLACIVGHNCCIGRFGGPWEGERLPLHGEAGVSPWTLEAADDGVILHGSCEQQGLRLRRQWLFDGDRLTVATTVTHDGEMPREIEWCEHVSLGDPFLDGAAITADIDAAWTHPDGPEAHWRWADPLLAVDPEQALTMPPAEQGEPMGDIITGRVQTGWFELERQDLGRRLRYEWAAEDWPWLCLWSEHRSRTMPPWNGVERARGMEFSTKPFPEGRPPTDRHPTWQGRSTQCLVPPGAGLTKTFTIRWS